MLVNQPNKSLHSFAQGSYHSTFQFYGFYEVNARVFDILFSNSS